MAEEVLRLDLKQNQAHYRNPKFSQNDFIPSLKLPGKTTIMGFLTYLLGRRINSEVEIGIIGEHKNKTIDFIRGEELEFQKKYKSFQKGKEKFKYLLSPEYVEFYKETSSNTILREEILREVNLKIFIKIKDEKEFKAVKEALENPKNYMALGRKEDFLMPRKKGTLVEVIKLESFKSDDIRSLLKEGIKIKNTYIKIDLANPVYDEFLTKGELFSVASTYKDLQASKNHREYVMSKYIYLDSAGIYPKDLEVNVYRTEEGAEVFTWL